MDKQKKCDNCGEEVHPDDLNADVDGGLYCDSCAVDIIQAAYKERNCVS